MVATKSILLTFVLASLLCRSQEGQSDTIAPQEAAQTEGQTLANQEHPLFMEEWEKTSAIDLDWGHVQTLSFLLDGTKTNDFVVKLDSDHELKGVAQIFWEEDKVYIEPQYDANEIVRMMIYENGVSILTHESFHKTGGFKIQAKKGIEYVLKFMNSGKKKLLTLTMDNYLSEGTTSNVLDSEHLEGHNQKLDHIKSKLSTFLGMAEQHASFNKWVSDKILLRTNRYLHLQMFELLIVSLAVIVQFIAIRKLMHRSSSAII